MPSLVVRVQRVGLRAEEWREVGESDPARCSDSQSTAGLLVDMHQGTRCLLVGNDNTLPHGVVYVGVPRALCGNLAIFSPPMKRYRHRQIRQ